MSSDFLYTFSDFFFLKKIEEHLQHVSSHSFLNDQHGWHVHPYLSPSPVKSYSRNGWRTVILSHGGLLRFLETFCIFCGNKIQSRAFQMPLWEGAALTCLVWDQNPQVSSWKVSFWSQAKPSWNIHVLLRRFIFDVVGYLAKYHFENVESRSVFLVPVCWDERNLSGERWQVRNYERPGKGIWTYNKELALCRIQPA